MRKNERRGGKYMENEKIKEEEFRNKNKSRKRKKEKSEEEQKLDVGLAVVGHDSRSWTRALVVRAVLCPLVDWRFH